MGAKYVPRPNARPPSADDGYWEVTGIPSITVFEADDGFEQTGLLDSMARPLYRAPRLARMGFDTTGRKG